MPVAIDVLLPLPLGPLQWLVPYGQAPGGVGLTVVVPWQQGIRIGTVTGIETVSDARSLEFREAIAWLPDDVVLPSETLKWLLAEADRTVTPAGTLLASLSLPRLRRELTHEVRRLDQASAGQDAWQAADTIAEGELRELREQGLLEERVTPKIPTDRVMVPIAEVGDARLEKASRAMQKTAVEELSARGWVASGSELARIADVPESAIRSLVRNGFAGYEERPKPSPEVDLTPPPEPWPASLIQPAQRPDPQLSALMGGTASDRARALVPLLLNDIAQGGWPIVLVPERRLADQLAAWFANDLPVALLPSELGARERSVWDRCLFEEGARVVVGTWSVLATSVPKPSRLILFDAGSDAYKLRSGARTWIPHAAQNWAEQHEVPLTITDVLHDPESMALVPDAAPPRTLPLPRPAVRWVLSDLTKTHSWPLSDEAIRVLKQVQDRDRQAIILVPRRGFSAALGCRECGAAVMCPNCDLALRWHARDRRLRCHQCGHDTSPPPTCPACGSLDMEAQRAAGSEWVLRTLAEAVPELPRYRYDGDVRDDLTPLHAGQPGVVVGTTALLRLEPLPVLSLLLVSQVDGALHADDFRAEVRVLRLLLRFEHQAGLRNPLGMIQTFASEHAALRAFVSADPEALHQELTRMNQRRARFGYPPHGQLALLQASAKRIEDAMDALRAAVARLETAGAEPDEILGPAPAPVARVRGRALAHVILRTGDEARRATLLETALSQSTRGVKLRVDVDPRDIGDVLE